MRYLQKNNKTIKIDLDTKDKRILNILSKNCRTPLTRIAKQVKLSRDAIAYRIKNYEKNGLIQGYITSVDISKFDYKNYHLFLKINNPSKEVEEKIIKKLSNLPFVRVILKYSGNYDLEVGIIARDFKELDSFIERIIESCYSFLQEYEFLLIVDTYIAKTFPASFFEGQKEDIDKKEKIQKKISLDDKDIEILKIIGDRADISLADISFKTKLSVDAVSYRLKNMQKEKVINSFVPILNYTSLNYSLYGLLLNINSLNEENKRILQNFLLTNKSVLWAVKTVGKFNTLIYFLVKDINEFQENLILLRSLFPGQISSYESLIAYEEYKYLYFPKDLF